MGTFMVSGTITKLFIPDDWYQAENMMAAGQKFIDSMEKMSQADDFIRKHEFDAMTNHEN
ncbi:MAG: hypothetical protein LUE29_04320 [Lachnospiraceae bacterium]|nr:hypothetical protein [Lachnospiraceae bacterium]